MILLDTNALVWLTGQKAKLSPAAIAAITETRDRNHAIALSDISLWEISLITSRGRISLPTPLPAYLEYVEKSFRVIPITGAVAQRSMTFSSRYPKDPADRIIGATALVHGLSLVTADGPIRETGEVPCIW